MMLQEIEPYHFINAYHPSRPEPEDYVLSVRGWEILIGGEPDGISFPRCGDLPERDRDAEKLIYLFAEDETKFFLCRDLALEGYAYIDARKLRGGGPRHLIYAALVGVQLARWYETHGICGRCGTPMRPDEKERMLFCPSCGLQEYPKICPCVIVAVIHEGKLLVSRYKDSTRPRYALTAGFAEVGETIEEAAAREVFEETHLKIKNLRFYKSQPWPYSDSLLFGFFAELEKEGEIIIQQDELSLAKWISPEEITDTPENFSLTNEMIHKFKEDYGAASVGEARQPD